MLVRRELALALLHAAVMSEPPVQRRRFPRASLDGLARLDVDGSVHNFRLADISRGGLGLTGDAATIPLGARVRVMITCAVGKRLDTVPRVETWAIVARSGDTAIGLSWSPATIEDAMQIRYLVEDSSPRR